MWLRWYVQGPKFRVFSEYRKKKGEGEARILGIREFNKS
jgi:hypothetical protein